LQVEIIHRQLKFNLT